MGSRLSLHSQSSTNMSSLTPALSETGKASVDAFVAESAADPAIPPFVVGATSASGEIYFNASGHNTINDPLSGALTPDSVLWICSQTKFIVHLAALHLLQHHPELIQPSDPVWKFLPQFKVENTKIVSDVMAPNPSYSDVPNGTPIRVEHLLNFSSGLFYPSKGWRPDHQLDVYVAEHGDGGDTVQWFVDGIKEDAPGIPLKFEPGTDFAYGWSSDVLGFVVEKVSGKSLEAYLQEHIFKPLEMTNTSFYLTQNLKEKLVNMTYRNPDGSLVPFADRWRLFETDPTKLKHHFSGIGLYSTPRDYLKLCRHILQIKAGTAPTPILPLSAVETIFLPAQSPRGEASLNAIFAFMPHSPKSGHSWSTASCLATADWPGGRKAGTAHWSGWAMTFHFVDPTTGVAVFTGTQVTPAIDGPFHKFNAEFERVLYGALEK